MPPTPPAPPVRSRVSPILYTGIFILVLILATVAYLYLLPSSSESVRMILRTPEGTTYGNYSLFTHLLSSNGEEVPATIIKSRTLDDTSVIALGSAGVLYKAPSGVETLLIASATPPSASTPIAISKDGKRIAWVNPSDGSLQVFEVNARGAYLPVFISKDVKVNSLGFTQNDATLLVASVKVGRDGTSETMLYTVDIDAQQMKSAGSLSGFATIVP